MAASIAIHLEGVCLSPGQWGSGTSLAIWMIAFGCLIAGKVQRMDTAWLFLVFYLGGLLIHVIFSGDTHIYLLG